MKDKTVIGFIVGILGIEWLNAVWTKFASPDFVKNFPNILQGFADNTKYDFYQSFIEKYALPNAGIFVQLVRFGELFVGIVLISTALDLITKNALVGGKRWVSFFALVAGLLMNINFYLASGWSSPSAIGINLVMGLIELVLVIYVWRLPQAKRSTVF